VQLILDSHAFCSIGKIEFAVAAPTKDPVTVATRESFIIKNNFQMNKDSR
jgi:hypothetical protein